MIHTEHRNWEICEKIKSKCKCMNVIEVQFLMNAFQNAEFCQFKLYIKAYLNIYATKISK